MLLGSLLLSAAPHARAALAPAAPHSHCTVGTCCHVVLMLIARLRRLLLSLALCALSEMICKCPVCHLLWVFLSGLIVSVHGHPGLRLALAKVPLHPVAGVARTQVPRPSSSGLSGSRPPLLLLPGGSLYTK